MDQVYPDIELPDRRKNERCDGGGVSKSSTIAMATQNDEMDEMVLNELYQMKWRGFEVKTRCNVY